MRIFCSKPGPSFIPRRGLRQFVAAGMLACVGLVLAGQATLAQFAPTPEQQAYLATRAPITMCVDPDWMPYEMIDQHGTHVGMGADYLRLFESRIGKPIQLVPTKTWNESTELAKRRACDILSMLNRSPERSLYLNFTDPYLRAPVALITNQASSEITDLESMTGQTLGLVKGYVYEEIIKGDFPGIDYREIKTIDEGLLKVSRGELTAIVTSLYIATHRILELGIGNLRIAGTTPYVNQFRVGVRNDDPKLLAVFREAVASLSPEDHIRIRRKWHRIETEPSASGETVKLSPDEAAYLQGKGAITMCVDPDWMPYEKIDETGRHVGMAADYIALIAKRVGTPIRLIPSANWTQSLKLARARTCDIMSSLNDTPERRQFLTFTRPYIESPLVLVTKTGAPFTDGLANVGDRKVSIPADYAHGEFVRRDYPDIPVVDVPSVGAGLEKVSKGEVFAHYGSLYVVVNEIQKAQLSNLKVNGHTEFRNRLSVGVRNDDPVLLSILNRAVHSITPEEHIQIRRKWTATRFEHGVDYDMVWKVAAVAAGVLLLVVLWNRKLATLNHRLQHEITLRETAERRLSELNEDLNRSNTELEQFAYAASHDLQEPLRTITNYLRFLEEKLGNRLDDESKEFMDFAVGGAKRMHDLVQGLLEYSRIGTRAGTFEPVDLTEVLREAQDNLSVAISETGARIDVPDRMPVVHADPKQMVRVFQNLIGNAIKYIAPGRPPRVQIQIACTGNECRCSVSDNGIGIEPQYAEQIFTMFKRLHGAGDYEGVGIGLAVVKRIVERHGGRIQVESTPGAGSTFSFTLPKKA